MNLNRKQKCGVNKADRKRKKEREGTLFKCLV